MSEANQDSPVAAAEAPTRPEVAEAQEKTEEDATSTNSVEAKTEEVATDAPEGDKVEEPVSSKDTQPVSEDVTQESSLPKEQEDVVMKDSDEKVEEAPQANTNSAESAEAIEAAGDTPASTSKSKSRRKSGGVPEHKNKKLNKKASKAKITHTDAKPGDYFFVKLKGYPLWPAIVCDESMLPNTLLNTRPVTAARADGTYRADYDDGGPKAKDRTFPVMYLHTNEFGWIPNYDLVELDPETVGDVTSGARKDLQAAHHLAAEQHDLQFFKDLLQDFMDAKQAEAEAREAKMEAKKASKAKRKSKATVDDDEDVEMADVDADEEADVAEKPKSKKRKAEDDANTPQRSDSVKKPRPTIKLTNKLTSTPKAANGAATPKSAKEPKSAKDKSSKKKQTSKVKEKEASEEVVSPQPELTPEEKKVKKEKEILFYRHKLQKGLLDKGSDPEESQMPSMAEFMDKLEAFPDLEVSIIRATKINKVLKAIIKLPKIPMEEEFHFKPRSTALLDKWNKILNSEDATPTAPAATNGNDEESKGEADESKTTPIESTNGLKKSSADAKGEEKTVIKESETKDVASVEEAAKESAAIEAAT